MEHLIGSSNADNLTGDASDNSITGGGGDDALNGGRGDDAFLYAPNSGADTITGFAPGAASDDHLDFSAYAAITGIGSLTVQAQGSDTLIMLPGGETIKLLQVAANALHADDYRFAGAPLARADQFNTPANATLTITAPGVLGNDDNPSATPLSAVLVDTTDHGALTLQANGAFTYSPVSNYVGQDEFTYQANNGKASNVVRVTITVTAVPPTANDDQYFVALGETLQVSAPGVLANDVNPGGAPLQATVVAQPVDGVLTLNANGSFTYTPSVDLPSEDSFTYQASNGLGSNVASVRIHILDPDGPPVAADDGYNVAIDETLNVGAPGVLGNDVNPLPGAMTVVPGRQPAHGDLTLNDNGSFSFTPDAGYNGQDSFTYRADNGQLSNEATVTLTIGDIGHLILLPAILGN
jgi:hypothetical protein